MPDQQKFLNSLRDRDSLRNYDQAGAFMMDYEICKVPRHRADIVRHKDSTERRGKSQNIGILHPFRNTILRKFEIDIGLAPENASNNILIKVLVREETDLQEDLGRASSLARRTFSERLGGNGVSLIPSAKRSCSFKKGSTSCLFAR